nr:hypothetical protein GCM10025699_77090 [Microbacterium flavescens]
MHRDGRYVAVTRKQFAVLEVLVAADGGVVSAEQLLERAWDENADPFTNAVRITVSALRKRLGEPWVIATVPGVGYRIDVLPPRWTTAHLIVARRRGPSARLRLTLSFAGVVVVTGALLLAVVWLYLLRYVPRTVDSTSGFVPGRGDLVDAFAPRAALALVVLLVLGMVCGWLLAGRLLAPSTAWRRPPGSSVRGRSHRVGLMGRSDEFRELADAFDAMLTTVEAQVESQRRFAADASHELRTPLAVTRTLLDVAREDPSHDPSTLVERLSAINTRAVNLTEALLLSRAGHQPPTGETVDLSLLAEEAVETLLSLAERKAITLEAAGDTAVTTGSPALLLQVATNLVHNGVVHNCPRPGRTPWTRSSASAPASTATTWCSRSRAPARRSRPSCCRRSRNRSGEGPRASTTTTAARGSASRSWTPSSGARRSARRRSTTRRRPGRPGAPAPTPTGDDDGCAVRVARTANAPSAPLLLVGRQRPRVARGYSSKRSA